MSIDMLRLRVYQALYIAGGAVLAVCVIALVAVRPPHDVSLWLYVVSGFGAAAAYVAAIKLKDIEREAAVHDATRLAEQNRPEADHDMAGSDD